MFDQREIQFLLGAVENYGVKSTDEGRVKGEVLIKLCDKLDAETEKTNKPPAKKK